MYKCYRCICIYVYMYICTAIYIPAARGRSKMAAARYPRHELRSVYRQYIYIYMYICYRCIDVYMYICTAIDLYTSSSRNEY